MEKYQQHEIGYHNVRFTWENNSRDVNFIIKIYLHLLLQQVDLLLLPMVTASNSLNKLRNYEQYNLEKHVDQNLSYPQPSQFGSTHVTVY